MATVSIKENLVIHDKAKVKEVLEAMEKPPHRDIKPAEMPQMPKDALKIWFKH